MTPAELLAAHPFAEALTEAQIAKLTSCAKLGRYSAGAIIFREGGDASALFLVVSGRVVLDQYVPGKGDLQLETLTRGDVLGLSWLFPGTRWALDARAAEPSELLSLDAACVKAAMAADAALGLALATYVIRQLYQRLERVRLQRLDVYRVGA